jgi:pimeloyl-ACP methyl ester carboxylesterase
MASVAASPSFLTIPTKPSAPISHTFFPGSVPSLSEIDLVVFVNGLGLPASSWLPSIKILHSSLDSCPPLLTYDRFGQGLTTARDPLESQTEGKGSHDLLDAAHDLHEIIRTIAENHGLMQTVEDGKLRIMLVGASVGAPITRLYGQYHPGLLAAAILLDSNIASANYSDIWPDPDAPGFDPSSVIADDCTLEQYREHRTKLAAMFDLGVKNAEGLDRSNGPSLLPYADKPKLVGPGGTGTLLSVVGHDPITFAEVSEQRMGTPKSLSMKFTNRLVARRIRM